MTNDYRGLYSTRTNQYIHYNHGWWCTECTNQLFDIDKQTDHTIEWIEGLRQWAEIGLLLAWDTLLMLGGAAITLIIGIAWIVICFFDSVDSDTRIYERELKERDGLERHERDSLNRNYNQLLKERHYLIKSIHECESNLAKGPFVAKEKSYKGPEQDFIERGARSTSVSPRVDQDQFQLGTYQARLYEVEGQLIDFERELRTHQGA